MFHFTKFKGFVNALNLTLICSHPGSYLNKSQALKFFSTEKEKENIIYNKLSIFKILSTLFEFISRFFLYSILIFLSFSIMIYLFLIFIALLIFLDIINCDTELVSSFIAFSYLNKNPGPRHGNGSAGQKYPHIKDLTDEEIEEAKFYLSSDELTEDEKTLEFYIKRDMHFQGDDCYDDINYENLPPEIANQFKETLTKINKEKIVDKFNNLRNADKDSVAKKYILKDNWEVLFNNGKSPYRDDNDLKNNKKSFKPNKKSSKPFSKSNTSNTKRSYSTYKENPLLQNDNLKLNKKTPFLTYSPVYLKIKEIYEDKNKDVFERQREVEYLINEKWLDLYTSKNKGMDNDAFLFLNLSMNKFILKLIVYFNTKKKSFKKFLPLIEMKKQDIAFIVFNELKPILNSGIEINSTTLSGKIGKSLYERWIRELYLSSLRDGAQAAPEKKLNNNLNFIKFKEDFSFKEEDYHDVGDLLRQILLEDDELFYRRIDKTDPKDTKAFITVSYKVQEMFKHHHDVIGLQLAMICPPAKWSDDNYGGYLRNKEKLFIDLITPSSKSKMKSVIGNELIYNTVNYLSSIPYKINTEVLDFINLNANEIGLLQNLHPKTSKLEEYNGILNNKIKDKTISKLNIKKILKDVLSYNSNYYLEKNILGLANLYSLVDQFYFTINLDWRGRLYSESSYLNFQGNDLSKALILFKNGKIISTEGLHYFKIYGANLYGNNKLSFIDRIKWIDENHENIKNMDLDFINKADKKFLFIAFCFEYKNYLSNPTEFKTHLPILLDASCNGMQHLSAMIGDSVIAKNVNLLENDPYLKPYDFYTFCLKLVKNKLDSIDLNDINYIRIRNLKLNRSVVKRTIMTIPYNVKKYGILLQLEESFEWVKIDNENLLKPKWYNTDQTPIYITKKELYALSDLIHTTLFESHPLLKDLVKYLNDMAELLFKLSLPIVWITPSGLIIKQSYTKFKKIRVKPSMNKTNASYTILIPSKDMDLSKQKAAFMPNLVHSMDAANICLMVDYLIKENSYINLLTVHDCFASSANSIQTINTVVRLGFLRLYANNDYLIRLYDFYLNYIKQQNFNIIDYNTVITNSDEELPIPTPPNTNDLQLNDILNKAIYFIH